MGLKKFKEILGNELGRIDSLGISKRNERVIEGFWEDGAIIGGRRYVVFNSNDYLGLRLNKKIISAEEEGTKKYGAGPGAVRFISGTTEVHKNLELAIAKFHGREDAILFSSAFSANLSVLHSLIKGQSVDSLVSSNTLVISDELNHRSIIEGIRVSGISKLQKEVFSHMNYDDLERIIRENKGKFRRVIIVTDGIFSMLGEAQDIKKIKTIAERYDDEFEEGILVVVDDAHRVGCFGKTGRGCEEFFGARADIIIGTLGKAFGADGGYVTGDKIFIDYFRESAASYVYSNPISGGNASAGLEALRIISEEGVKILKKLNENIKIFKEGIVSNGLKLASDSNHAIQPILIGDPEKTKKIVSLLFDDGFLVTGINYPIVPKGCDEIRVQISAAHKKEDIENFVDSCERHMREIQMGIK
ncbi:MAG: aminotransferase class I/II-fold pyridoxal phosphate-dependent enzyme [Candidatus Pacearchaeota archaeon]|nr:aminotransferase class I/II-fold pyridoxal phosphate-dependent enzyme [Candidatus Pacearchaeota archaeon]